MQHTIEKFKSELKDVNKRPSTLKSLEILLSSNPKKYRLVILQDILPRHTLIDWILNCDEQVATIAQTLLYKLDPPLHQTSDMSQEEVDECIKQHDWVLSHTTTHLLPLFQCKYPRARSFAIKQIQRLNLPHDISNWEENNNQETLLQMLVNAFVDPEVSIPKEAHHVIVQGFCQSIEGLNWLFDKNEYTMSYQDWESYNLLQKIEQNCKNDSINQSRFLELIISISAQSKQSFEYSEEFLNLIPKQVQSMSNDELGLLSTLELVNQFLSIPFIELTIPFLIEKEFFELITQLLLIKYKDDEMVEGFLMSIIGQMISILGEFQYQLSQKSQDVSKHIESAMSHILPKHLFLEVLSRVQSDQAKLQQISLQLIGCVISSNESLLEDFLSSKYAKSFFEYIFLTHETDSQSAFLQSMATVLQSRLISQNSIENFFNSFLECQHSINPQTTLVDELLHILKNPFKEIRVSVFQFIRACSLHVFSLKRLLAHPVFMDKMLDRSTEEDHDCMQSKYDALSTISLTHSTHAEQEKLLSTNQFIQVRTYIHQGPFALDIQAGVAVAEQVF